MERLAPRSTADVAAIVADCTARGHRLNVIGAGTRAGLGHPVTADAVLDLGAFAGIESYEPGEQIITLGPATPLAELDAVLTDSGQRLAFDPPDTGPLFGEAPGLGTIGGAVAANLAGPARPRAGAARDHLLGIEAVSGRGEVFKAGGRVVKNVTGYDLPKLLAGSFGTLAVMTRLTLRLGGRPPGTVTAALLDIAPAEAGHLMQRIAGSGLEPVAIAYLPAEVAVRERHPLAAAALLVRFEGPASALPERLADLQRLVGTAAPVEAIEGPDSDDTWAAVRDVAGLLPDGERALWRLSLPPAAGCGVAMDLTAALPGLRWFADWAGARLWLAVPAGADAAAETVRAAARAAGGHALLFRAPLTVKARVPVFEPPAAGVGAIERSLRAAFDPAGILNPGKMGPA
ncbi:FAD-binding protein [Zavarzinia compransoris]|uniref:FAD-binding protein n=1 Tax=Zavarzinia marina TaxID=2911065 RepID=UPI001F1DF666|nr:FAD-binding protein [Zavarzinia marina]MCF4166169.1 FAD-binding protein [Zavarzinia marina]